MDVCILLVNYEVAEKLLCRIVEACAKGKGFVNLPQPFCGLLVTEKVVTAALTECRQSRISQELLVSLL